MTVQKVVCLGVVWAGLVASSPLSAQQPKLRATFKGHAINVTSLTFTVDGKKFASGDQKGTVKVWDVTTGKEIHTFKGHTGEVNSVAFSADGTMLISGASGLQEGKFIGEVKLWDLTTGKEGTTLLGHSKWVNAVAFSPDGRTLASGSDDYEVKLWDSATGKEIHTFKGHTSRVSALTFTPDGKILVSSGHGMVDRKKGLILGEVKFWDVAKRTLIRTLKTNTDFVASVAVSGDGKTLAVGDRDRVTLWEVATGNEIRTFKGPTLITSVAFFPKDTILAASGEDQKSGGGAISPVDPRINFWSVETGKELITLPLTAARCVAFSPDGKAFASVEFVGGDVMLWDMPVFKTK
jgi:WD40 repeat protein